MVASAIRTPRPRIGLANAAPLRDRWLAMQARVQREIPVQCHQLRATANLACSESAVDAMEDALDEARYQSAAAAVPVDYDSPYFKGARDELFNLQKRYHSAWGDLRDTRRKLHPSSVVHEILQDVPPDYEDIPPQIFTGRDPAPNWRSVAEVRAAIEDFLPKVLSIEGRLAQLNAAAAIESGPLPEQNRALIEGLFRRLVKLEHHVDEVRQGLRDLNHPQRKQRRKS